MGLRALRLTPTFVNSPDNRCVAQRCPPVGTSATVGAEKIGARHRVRLGQPHNEQRQLFWASRHRRPSSRLLPAPPSGPTAGAHTPALIGGEPDPYQFRKRHPALLWVCRRRVLGCRATGSTLTTMLVRVRVSWHRCPDRPQRAQSSFRRLPNTPSRPPLCSADPCPSPRAQARSGVGLRDAGASGGSSIPRSG